MTQLSSQSDTIALDEILIFLRAHLRRFSIAAAIGVVVGATIVVLSPRSHTATATFLPSTAEASALGGIARAASQFGLSVPSGSGEWDGSVYTALVRSRAVLEPIILKQRAADGQSDEATTLLDLFDVEGNSDGERLELGLQELRDRTAAAVEKQSGIIRVSATTRWPELSRDIVEELLLGVQGLAVEVRAAQARAEREFAEARVSEAADELRAIESRLETFLVKNRQVELSPTLTFERDRLAREVQRQQDILAGLLQHREEAWLRESRDTPVLSILDAPEVPALADDSGLIAKSLAAGLLLGALAVAVTVVQSRGERGFGQVANRNGSSE